MNIKLNLLDERSNLFKDNSSTLVVKHKFEQPQKALGSQNPRALCLENINVLSSKVSKVHKFTNFQSHLTKNDCNLTLSNLVLDLLDNEFKKVKFELDENIEDMSYSDKVRLCDIINLYSNIDISELSIINKAKVKDSMDRSTSFRIFLKLTKESYQIILLDPLHFAIPSRKQNEKGYRFEDNKWNNLCMVKHIILKEVKLTKTYKELKKLSEIICYD